MGMAPLALFLADDDCEISGFDDSPNALVIDMLRAKGIDLCKSRTPTEEVDEFIITSALKRDAEKLKSARAKKFLRRGEALAEVAKSRRLIGVCGSHGKTTTSSLIAHAILRESLDAGFVTGALPVGFSPSKHCESGKFLAAELDESDATIENFSPEICVALNGDLDHTDTYADFSALGGMFERLFRRTKSCIVIPRGDELLRKAAEKAKAQVVEIEVPADDFMTYDKRMALCALNLAFGSSFGIEIFDDFKGVFRRQEVFASNERLFAVADYAHHPGELRAFLSWLDSKFAGEKLLFFQPHRYTRTKRFAEDFKAILERRARMGDRVFLLPVYAASEIFDAQADSKILTSENVKLVQAAEMDKILRDYKADGTSRKCVAFIGAGDIYFEAKKLFNL